MKERFDLDLAYVASCMTSDDDGDEMHMGGLELSAACYLVSIEGMSDLASTPRTEGLVSFRYVAAALCLREIERAKDRLKMESDFLRM